MLRKSRHTHSVPLPGDYSLWLRALKPDLPMGLAVCISFAAEGRMDREKQCFSLRDERGYFSHRCR